MKIIFLDIDGVLNHQEFYTAGRHNDQVEYPASNMDPLAIANLNRIIKMTGAKVVISSTWRLGNTIANLQRMLELRGFKGEVIGVTDSLDLHHACIVRGNEILKWIQDSEDEVGFHFNFNTYVIFDDDEDMLYQQKDNFLKCDEFTGLTSELADKAIHILNNNRNVSKFEYKDETK